MGDLIIDVSDGGDPFVDESIRQRVGALHRRNRAVGPTSSRRLEGCRTVVSREAGLNEVASDSTDSVGCGADANEELAEVLALQQTDECLGRVLETFDDVLTMAQFA